MFGDRTGAETGSRRGPVHGSAACHPVFLHALESLREVRGVHGFAVELDADVALVHPLHDFLQRDQISRRAVVFQADPLAVIDRELAQRVERAADLFYGFSCGTSG